MLNPTKLLDAIQSEWPLIASLSIVGISDHLPHWAVASARRVSTQIAPASVVAYRAQLRRRSEQLAALHRRWIVAAVLAVLLAAAVVCNAMAVPLDSLHLGILSGVLCAILLPPIAICNGIARDYVATRALALVLSSAVVETKVQRAN